MQSLRLSLTTRKLSDYGGGKIPRQAAKERLLLFKREVPQCCSRLDRVATLQQSHRVIPVGLGNRVLKPLSDW